MKEFILVVVYCLIVNSRCQGKIEEKQTSETCAQVTRIVLAVNLVDEECLRKSGNSSSITAQNENSIEVNDVEMNTYAFCLLKKSSIINDAGEVNLNFDIVKIVKHLFKKTDEHGLGLAFIIKALDKCRDLSGSDQFVTVTKIMKCLLDNQETILWCNRH